MNNESEDEMWRRRFRLWQSGPYKLAQALRSHSTSVAISEEGIHDIIRYHKVPNNEVYDYKFFHNYCKNHNISEGIIRCLIEYFPAAANDLLRGQLPLHSACRNGNVSLGIIQLLIDAAPGSVRRTDRSRNLPLHILCDNNSLDDSTASEITQLLLEEYPESIQQCARMRTLPIHSAALSSKSTGLFNVLIKAYPGSERIAGPVGMLPIHCACDENSVETVKYLYKLYPDAIGAIDIEGRYPIHVAFESVTGSQREANPRAAVDIVKFLLDCDPRVKLQYVRGTVPTLALAYSLDTNDTNLGAAMEIIEEIYDAHPEAIEHEHLNDPHVREPELQAPVLHPEVQTFFNDQLVYSLQAKDEHVMSTPDDDGHLPLHKALQNNVRLGSIKLLAKGLPNAVRYPDNSGALPLHLACMHHKSAGVVQYLCELDATTLEAVDHENNTALHYACRVAKFETIGLLLEEYDAVSVSKQNAEGKLPIEVLWESDEVVDRESVEYTECVFRLMRAYPETVMNHL